jgi:hypothetical protein
MTQNAAHSEEQKGFQFPCTLEVTAMGDAIDELEAIVLSELVAAGLEPDLGSVRHKSSSGGKYRSIAVAFDCDSRERYAEAHARLRAHPAIKWTL